MFFVLCVQWFVVASVRMGLQRCTRQCDRSQVNAVCPRWWRVGAIGARCRRGSGENERKHVANCADTEKLLARTDKELDDDEKEEKVETTQNK